MRRLNTPALIAGLCVDQQVGANRSISGAGGNRTPGNAAFTGMPEGDDAQLHAQTTTERDDQSHRHDEAFWDNGNTGVLSDRKLRQVVLAWPSLSQPVKAGILAMVQAAIHSSDS